MNLPNKITLFRVIMIPVFLVLCYIPDSTACHYAALVVFILASCSDFLDGHIARSRGLVTDFGKFMDPLADKMLVLSAMLVLLMWGQFPAWAIAVVLTREFAVSGLRMMAATGGKVIAAGWSGKVKTASTMVCICLMFFPIPAVLNTVCWIVIVVTTVYSGAEYFIKGRNIIDWSNL